MFKDKKNGEMSLAHAGQETIIAQGVKVEGDFRAEGDVLIDGEVTGSVLTNRSLKIGETARIEADIVAKSAVIAGEVQGNIRAEERLELLSTSRVHGDIETKLISVAEGATVNGRITMDAGETGKQAKRGAGRNGKEAEVKETEEAFVEG